MFGLKELTLKENEEKHFTIYFDNNYIGIWGVNPNNVHPIKSDKLRTLDFTTEVKEIVFNSKVYGKEFVRVLAIIFSNLDIGNITTIDSQISYITISLEDLQSIDSEYRVIFINEYDIINDKTNIKLKGVYKITRID